MVWTVLSLGYGKDVRGNVVRFPVGVRNISLLQSIQKVVVVHTHPYLVGTGDSVPWSKAAGT